SARATSGGISSRARGSASSRRSRTGRQAASARCRATRNSSRCRKSARALLEDLRPGRTDEPLVPRARPDMARDRQPVGIVERARRERTQAGIELERPGDGAAALRAELILQPASALVRAVLVGSQLAVELDVALVEVRAHAERAAGAALAAAAVAGGLAHRLVRSAEAHRTAVAAALVDLRHGPSFQDLQRPVTLNTPSRLPSLRST